MHPASRWPRWAPRGLEWPGRATSAPPSLESLYPTGARVPSRSRQRSLPPETTSAPGRAGEEGCLCSPRCSLPRRPARGLPSPGARPSSANPCSLVGAPGLGPRGSCEGVCLSQWPKLHPRGRCGKKLGSRGRGKPRTGAAGQLARGGALCLTPERPEGGPGAPRGDESSSPASLWARPRSRPWWAQRAWGHAPLAVPGCSSSHGGTSGEAQAPF